MQQRNELPIDSFQEATANMLAAMAVGAETNSESIVLHAFGRVLQDMPSQKIHPQLRRAFRKAQRRFLPGVEFIGG